MGKTYRRDAKNAGWRRAKLERERQKNGGRKPEFRPEQEEGTRFSPFDISQEEHENFA